MSAEHAASPDFPVVRRGYDMNEVDRFLTNYGTIWEAKLQEATARIARLEAELEEAKRREEAVHLTLVTATRTKEELMEAAQRDLSDATGNAREQAEKILSEAKFEAFRLVTEANKDAEQIIDQARSDADRAHEQTAALNDANASADEIRAAAQAEAEQIRAEAAADAEARVASAQSESLRMITEIKEESERMVAERERELERMRVEFEANHAETIERVQNLQSLAGDLEQRLQSVASGALGELTSISTDLTSPTVNSPQETAPTPQRTTPPEAPPLDESPESTTTDLVPEPEAAIERPAPQESETTTEESGRGSFYSRRSAKLPRIGADAASGALAAVSAMRAAQRRDDHGIEIVVTEGDPEKDVAMQSA
ncbi:MAG: DivIVA domain-containing protein [Acidimicrobiia bacterium]|nr:DivIVA domain-containing protein [Acidimicrobiia bacterium]